MMTTATEALVASPPTTRLSYEEFLTRYDGIHAEWLDGTVQVRQNQSFEHQTISGFLLALISIYVQERSCGIALSTPFNMRLETLQCGREPDILFVRAEHEDRFRPGYLDGPADLAVEIISPESEARDRGDKFVEYQGAGIREYWLIDPLRNEITFYRLGEDQLYRTVALDSEGRFHSLVIDGFWIKPAWLWQRPMPPLRGVLKELGAL